MTPERFAGLKKDAELFRDRGWLWELIEYAEALQSALEAVEWAAQDPSGDVKCPYCGARAFDVGDGPSRQHEQNCIVGAALSEPSAAPALTQEERKEFVFKRWDGALRKMAEGPGAEPSAKTERTQRAWTLAEIKLALPAGWKCRFGMSWSFSNDLFLAALEGET